MSGRNRKAPKRSKRANNQGSRPNSPHAGGRSTPDPGPSSQDPIDPRLGIVDPRFGGQAILYQQRNPDPYGGQPILGNTASGHLGPYSSSQPTLVRHFDDLSITQRIREPDFVGHPINSGIYIITNAHQQRFVYFEDANDRTPLRGHYDPEIRGARWHVKKWVDGQYSIQNVDHGHYANCESRARLEAFVEGHQKRRLWRILESFVRGQYTIAALDNGNLWMLPDDEEGTPVTFSKVPTDPMCQWTFKSAETVTPVDKNPIARPFMPDVGLLLSPSGGQSMPDTGLLLAPSSGQPIPDPAIVELTSVITGAPVSKVPTDRMRQCTSVNENPLARQLMPDTGLLLAPSGGQLMPDTATFKSTSVIAGAPELLRPATPVDKNPIARPFMPDMGRLLAPSSGQPMTHTATVKSTSVITRAPDLLQRMTPVDKNPVALPFMPDTGWLLVPSGGQPMPGTDTVKSTSVITRAPDLLQSLGAAREELRTVLQRARNVGHVNEDREALIKRLNFHLATVENDIVKLEEDQRIDQTIPALNQDVRESLETYARELKEIYELFSDNQSKDSSLADEVTRKTHKIDEAFQRYTTALHQFAANTVVQMQQQLAQFRQEFQQGAHTAAGTARRNRRNAYGIQHRECLRGTREKTLPAISEWFDYEDTEKWIFFLLDVAGSGKSTVANHMAEKWRREDRLLARFFFSRDTTETMSTNSFCSTVAGAFAARNPTYKEHMDKFMKVPNVELLPFEERFEGLVAGPLRAIGRRAILIIDALDECDVKQRDELLGTLHDQHSSISLLRILATGRPERDIKRWAEEKFGFGYMNFTRLGESDKDVELYIKHTLRDVPDIQDRLYPVIRHAEGLFIWARIACDLLLDSDDIDGLLEELGREVSLDYLYKVALEQSTPKEGASRRAMVLVLQMILAAREPLSIAELEMLSPTSGVVEKVVTRLSSVLLYQGRQDPIRLLHATFRKFLVTRSKADIFFIQPELGHYTLASGCLATISDPSKYDRSTLHNLDTISQRKDTSFEQDTY